MIRPAFRQTARTTRRAALGPDAGRADGTRPGGMLNVVAAVVLWLVGREEGEEEPAEPLVGWSWTPGGLVVCW